MKTKTSFSTASDTSAAIAQITRELRDTQPRLVLFFASPKHAPDEVARAMAAAFPGVPTLGCTTAGEIVTGRMLDHAIVAMALGPELVSRVAFVPLPEVADRPAEAGRNAVATLARTFGRKAAELEHDRYFGLVLCDGLSGAEEMLIEAIGDATNIPFIGGSAGDDLAFAHTHVFADGIAYRGAALLALVEAAAPFEIVKTQSFRPRSRTLTATKVDVAQRRVLEFDGQPAAAAYAAALQVPVATLADHFMRHPLGLIAEGEPFVRSPQRVEGDSIRFYCQILPDTELRVLDAGDIVGDTRRALAQVERPVALINFHCILRTLELKDKQQCAAYGEVFDDVPTVGFSTYGEAYIGHINQTSTILAFKER